MQIRKKGVRETPGVSPLERTIRRVTKSERERERERSISTPGGETRRSFVDRFSSAVHKKAALIMREHIPGPGETLMLKLRRYTRDKPRTRALGRCNVIPGGACAPPSFGVCTRIYLRRGNATDNAAR